MGSDEIGNGDIFKPIIVTAAYVEPEMMESLLKLNVRDSKQINTEKEMAAIGEALTEIHDFSEVSDGTVVKTEYLTFCSKVLSNEEFDKYQREAEEKNKNDLLREFHADVVNALIEACHPDYIIVDDFMKGNEEKHKEFLTMLHFEDDKVFLRQKADGLNMAVSAASIISSYLGNLYLQQLNAQLKQTYGLTKELQPGADLKKNTYMAPLKELQTMMEKRGEKFEDFLKRYAKTTFQNVADWMENLKSK